MFVCILNLYTCVYIYIHVYTYVYICIFSYMYIYTYIHSGLSFFVCFFLSFLGGEHPTCGNLIIRLNGQ